MRVIFLDHKLCYFQQTRFVCHEDSIVLKCCNLFFHNAFCFLIYMAKILLIQISPITLLCNLAYLSLFLHFCVIFLRYSTLKMYFCSEIYQRTLARLAYMTDIKDFFIASNTVRNAPDYDSNVLSTLIHTVESFARVTYQSIYLIDYYKQEFLYVSDNPFISLWSYSKGGEGTRI